MSATSIEFTRYDPETRRTFWYSTHPNKIAGSLAIFIASLEKKYIMKRTKNTTHLVPKQVRTD